MFSTNPKATAIQCMLELLTSSKEKAGTKVHLIDNRRNERKEWTTDADRGGEGEEEESTLECGLRSYGFNFFSIIFHLV